jgi:hypothetical protein
MKYARRLMARFRNQSIPALPRREIKTILANLLCL